MSKSDAVILQFRETHHMVARLIACGCDEWMIEKQTGVSKRRIHHMRGVPSFESLIQFYQKDIHKNIVEDTEAYRALANKLMLSSVRQLIDKVEDAEDRNDPLPTRELLSIQADMADRLGYGKQTKHTKEIVDYAAMLDRAIARSAKVAVSNVIELKAVKQPETAPPATSRLVRRV